MIDVNFMASVKQNLAKAALSSKILNLISTANLQSKLDSYLQKNHFRFTMNDMADYTLGKLRNLAFHRYDDREVMVYKAPEVGVEDDFSFTFFGNEEYDKHVFDRYLERGMIFTSQDRKIIPKPREEAYGQQLLFRTSKGEVIAGDNFIDEFIQQEMKLNSSTIIHAYQTDVQRFVNFYLR